MAKENGIINCENYVPTIRAAQMHQVKQKSTEEIEFENVNLSFGRLARMGLWEYRFFQGRAKCLGRWPGSKTYFLLIIAKKILFSCKKSKTYYFALPGGGGGVARPSE